MSDEANRRAHLERFAELGAKHAFRRRRGVAFEGWIVDVETDAFRVCWAPSPFDAGHDVHEWISFGDILSSSLAYWDDTIGQWIDYPGA
ncbi:MAG: hypothetical protein AB7K24_02000 [Gemmataceae bacterium]